MITIEASSATPTRWRSGCSGTSAGSTAAVRRSRSPSRRRRRPPTQTRLRSASARGPVRVRPSPARGSLTSSTRAAAAGTTTTLAHGWWKCATRLVRASMTTTIAMSTYTRRCSAANWPTSGWWVGASQAWGSHTEMAAASDITPSVPGADGCLADPTNRLSEFCGYPDRSIVGGQVEALRMAERAALLESLRVVDLSRATATRWPGSCRPGPTSSVEAPGGSPARATLPRLAGTGWRSRCTTRTSAPRCRSESDVDASDCSICWPAPTCSSTPACRVSPPPSVRRPPTSPTASSTSSCCRSPTSGRRVRGRTGGPPTLCSTRCRPHCHGPARRRAPSAAAGRHRFGHRRRAGHLGRAGGLLSPIALWLW